MSKEGLQRQSQHVQAGPGRHHPPPWKPSDSCQRQVDRKAWLFQECGSSGSGEALPQAPPRMGHGLWSLRRGRSDRSAHQTPVEASLRRPSWGKHSLPRPQVPPWRPLQLARRLVTVPHNSIWGGDGGLTPVPILEKKKLRASHNTGVGGGAETEFEPGNLLPVVVLRLSIPLQ